MQIADIFVLVFILLKVKQLIFLTGKDTAKYIFPKGLQEKLYNFTKYIFIWPISHDN